MTDSTSGLIDLPRDSHRLIELLDTSYPPREIQKGETLEDAHRRAGRREIIDELVAWKEEEERRAEEKEQEDGGDMPKVLG